MLAVQVPLNMGKTLGGCGYMTNKKRRREDVGVDIEESKRRQKVVGKSRVKSISCDEAAELLCAVKTPSKTSITEALTRAEPFLLNRKRKAARASLLAMEKEVDNPEDNLETLKQLRMLCGGQEVVMGSFNMHQFGVELVLKKEEEEEEYCRGEINTPSTPSPSKEPLRPIIKRAQQKLLEKKREAARVSLLAMEKEVDNPEDNLETFQQLRMLCGGSEVVMGSFDLPRFGVDLVLKNEEEEEEEEEEDCHLSATKTPSSSLSKPPPQLAMTIPQHLLLPKKREAPRALHCC